MLLYTPTAAEVQLLPQSAAAAGGDGHPLVDHQAGDPLLLAIPAQRPLGPVEPEAQRPQALLRPLLHAVQRRPGESEVVAVAGIHHPPGPAPGPQLLVKGAQHQIGDPRRGRRALGKYIPVVTKHGEENPQRLGVDLRREGRLLHLNIADTVEKVQNVQLQQLGAAHMPPGILHHPRAVSVGGGMGRHGHA